jgi:hypothetical protein
MVIIGFSCAYNASLFLIDLDRVMHVFTSDWLKRMVSKSSAAPTARIVNLFAILQDWMDAPGIRPQLGDLDVASRNELQAFIHTLVSDAGLSEPEKLAFQLHFLLLGALNDELRNPGNKALERAGEAAAVMVAAARAPARFGKSHVLAAASFGVLAVMVGALTLLPVSMPQEPAVTQSHLAASVQDVVLASSRPDQLAAIYQLHDKLQTGQCSYPQALMLSADQRALFLDGVVNIDRLNATASNLDEVRQLYKKVDCSYAPAAMQL